MEYFETDNQRELRQIFAGQSQMFDALRELNRKLDEVVGRQERSLSLISQLQVGGKILLNYQWINIKLNKKFKLYEISRCASGRSTRTTSAIDRHDSSTRSRCSIKQSK